MGSDPTSAIVRRRTPVESAAAAGVVYSILSVAALTLVGRVPENPTAAEWSVWIGDPTNRRLLFVGLALASVAAVAFLWFVAVVRRRIGDREDRFFATVFFGSAMVHIAIWLVAVATVAALAIGGASAAGAPGPDIVNYARGISTALLFVAGPRIQAVFVASTSTMFLRTGAVPSWVAYFGYALAGLMFLVPIVATPLGLALPLFVFVSSVVILVAVEMRVAEP
jgi:hypothetical protein